MISNRPYLLRAFHHWIIDSNCTPILVIDAKHPHCKIPREYVEGGEIVFNISPVAVKDLKMSNELVEFKASFSGVIHIISAPIKSILAIYAEENGEGLFFDAEEDEEGGEEIDTGKMVHLKEVEGSNVEMQVNTKLLESETRRSKPILKLVE